MKHLIPSLCALALLAGCSAPAAHTSIERQNENPLTASRYGDELADRMANLVINQDPVANDPQMRAVIDERIAKGKRISADARGLQAQGLMGGWIAVKQDVFGYALLLNNTLYFSSDFAADPGPDLHLYLTSAVDPRDADFPDASAVDLGTMQTMYGAQQYDVPADKASAMRTAVLYDLKLKRLYGFAQLSR